MKMNRKEGIAGRKLTMVEDEGFEKIGEENKRVILKKGESCES